MNRLCTKGPWRTPLQRRGTPPQGFTLIELVMVVALTSALMMVAVSLLHGVQTWGQGAEKSMQRAASFHRLELALRKELRRATKVTADGPTLTLTTDAGKVVFQLEGDHCLQSSPGSNPPRFERYPLGPREPWQLELEEGLVDLRLHAPEGVRGAPFHVVAATKGTAL